MNSPKTSPKSARTASLLGLALALVLPLPSLAATHGWVQPTPAELSMTSIPEVPGAPAVILDYDEVDNDIHLHEHSFYARIKILTEEGKQYADVQLDYQQTSNLFDEGADTNYDDIAGRTIHSDGTIIPFTGKPYVKALGKNSAYRAFAKVFTLPDVQVGSIVEFHYTLHYPEGYVVPPTWDVQRNLFIRHEHFTFKGNSEYVLTDRGDMANPVIEWASKLPKGVEVQHTSLAPQDFNLDLRDVMPTPDEEYMPPLSNITDHVTFYYTSYSSVDKYWKGEGKYHSREWDKFIGPNAQVKSAVAQLIGPADAPLVKLKKIYDAVEAIDNTDFTREHSHQEDLAAGRKKIDSADDILALKHGNSSELTMLFVSMARAAGFKAYIMEVTDRHETFFEKNLPTWYQLHDLIAIVNVDGKEQFFDPGSRYCKFGELNWRHTDTGGVRQTDGDTALATTPPMPYKQSISKRIAVLNIDPTGIATGTLQVALDGAPALDWRQAALRGDTTSLNKDLEENISSLLPGGMDVKVKSIDGLTDPDQPLTITFSAAGPVGTATGKRILLQGDLYRSNEKPLLAQAKRTQNLFFNYASISIDIVKFTLPPNMTIDTLPAAQQFAYKNFAAYSYTVNRAPGNAILINRQYALGNYIYLVSEYADTRDFLNKVTQADQQIALLKQGVSPNGN